MCHTSEVADSRARLSIRALGACALLAAGSCSKILDFDETDGGASDASYTDSAPLTDDASADLYEPNDTPETAKPLEPGSYELSIFPLGDEDYWQVVLSSAADVTIEMNIAGDADLDLELYSISALEEPIAWSRGSGEREQILRTAADNGQLGPGVFLVRVFAFVDHATAAYALTLAVAD